MSKLEEIIQAVIKEIQPHHTVKTFDNRKRTLLQLLAFAGTKGFTAPCQELYDAFTANDKGSSNIRFHLCHAVRLVDRKAGTMATDRNGKLYNEPPLPTIKEVMPYFENVVFPVSNSTDIGYLIVFTEQLLLRYDLTQSTIGQYRHIWLDIRRFLMEHQIKTFHKDMILEFIRTASNAFDNDHMKTWKWKINRKAAYVLIEAAETGTVQWRLFPWCDRSCGDLELDHLRDQYIHDQASGNLESATLCLYEYDFRYSMKHGSISKHSQLVQINPETVTKIIEGFSHDCNKRSMATILPIIRKILRYLYEKQVVKRDYSGMVMPGFIQKNHVTTYICADDDVKLKQALKNESARNRAIILLALKLGLRDTDICELQFTSIDWNQDCLHIPQKKTDEPLCLPLLEEVGNAIMEYILTERPLPEDGYPYVFRRKQAPYKKITSAYMVCAHFLEKNDIHTMNKGSKGVHVFRYTLVNRLLRKKVPHQIITDTLGHRSKESDKPYLSMEADMLRLCALDLSIIGSISWKGDAYERN
jgi:integrase